MVMRKRKTIRPDSSSDDYASCCIFCCCFLLMCLVVYFTLMYFAGAFDPPGPRTPIYSIDSISVKNFNVSSEFDVTVRADNPNDDRTVINYLPGSSVGVFHNYVRVWSGAMPVFLQAGRNVTFVTATLKGARADLTRSGLVFEANRGAPVELNVVMKIPMSSKGSVKGSWKIELPVDCRLTVDKLFTDAKIVARHGLC